MPQRAAFTAALLVLALLVGGRWMMGRDPVEAVAQQRLGAAPAPAPASPTAPSPLPSPSPTKKASPSPRATIGPHDTKRLTGNRRVALTFDDGPHPTWTPQVLDALRAARAKATFCVVGTEVRKYPALMTRIVREGHTLCNHSWHHELDLGTRPDAEIRANLENTNREIRRAVPGTKIKYFRHPGGRWTPSAVKIARELGMASLDWDVDPRDWAKPTAKEIHERVLGDARPGSIVLLHDGGGDRAGTLAACPSILTDLKRKYGITLLR
jgi:peptidoglycan-N-acetylglucosamine deacetylase